MNAHIINALLFLAPALAMATPKSMVYSSLLLSVLGLVERFRHPSQALPALPDLLKVLLLLAVVTIALNAYHQDKWGTYHLPIAIFLCLPGFWAIQADNVRVEWLLLGSALGAMLGAALAVHQGGLDGVRAGGVYNPIPFGGIGLTLAAASLVALFRAPPWLPKPVWIGLHVLGVGGGLMASALSGSKAGWLAIPGLILIFGLMVHTQMPPHRRRYVWSAGVGLLAAGAIIGQELVLPRVLLSMQSVTDYVATGKASDDGSVAPRLELWSYGFSRIPNAPILGTGKRAMLDDMRQASTSGEFSQGMSEWATLHNEFVHITAVNGVVGLFLLAAVYISLWRLGWRNRNSGNPMAWFALLLVIVYLALGVGEVAVQLKDLRNTFLFWVIAITGFLTTCRATGIGQLASTVQTRPS